MELAFQWSSCNQLWLWLLEPRKRHFYRVIVNQTLFEPTGLPVIRDNRSKLLFTFTQISIFYHFFRWKTIIIQWMEWFSVGSYHPKWVLLTLKWSKSTRNSEELNFSIVIYKKARWIEVQRQSKINCVLITPQNTIFRDFSSFIRKLSLYCSLSIAGVHMARALSTWFFVEEII